MTARAEEVIRDGRLVSKLVDDLRRNGRGMLANVIPSMLQSVAAEGAIGVQVGDIEVVVVAGALVARDVRTKAVVGSSRQEHVPSEAGAARQAQPHKVRTVTCDDVTWQKLERMAASAGCSRSEMFRRLVRSAS